MQSKHATIDTFLQAISKIKWHPPRVWDMNKVSDTVRMLLASTSHSKWVAIFQTAAANATPLQSEPVKPASLIAFDELFVDAHTCLFV